MDIYWNTHTRTLGHRHARTHSLTHSPSDLHTIAARTLESGAACLQYASHTHAVIHTSIQTHCTNRCARKRPHTPSWTLSLSHTHTRTPTHSQSYTTTCQYCGQAFIEPLHTHSPLAVFGRQTMRNDSKWKCTTCSPIRPLSSKPNICVFLSVCTRLGVKSSEKKAPAYENVWEWLKAPSLVYKATVTNRRSFYCIYMV